MPGKVAGEFSRRVATLEAQRTQSSLRDNDWKTTRSRRWNAGL